MTALEWDKNRAGGYPPAQFKKDKLTFRFPEADYFALTQANEKVKFLSSKVGRSHGRG